MSLEPPTVFIVDDDPAMRESLLFAFSGTGLQVKCYASAEEFLAGLDPEARGCIILDLRMPGMGGLELHHTLIASGSQLPVIVLTGHGDVPTAVEQMKLGAFDFLSKPINRDVLLRRVGEAVALDIARRRDQEEMAQINRLLATLSARELQVMNQVALGQLNKQIAMSFGLSELTVANHRSRLLKKMEAINTADLVRMLGLVGRIPRRLTDP